MTSNIIESEKEPSKKHLTKRKEENTMKLEGIDTKQLLYAKYRYENCDGDCESCPCEKLNYFCNVTYEEIEKELERRETK